MVSRILKFPFWNMDETRCILSRYFLLAQTYRVRLQSLWQRVRRHLIVSDPGVLTDIMDTFSRANHINPWPDQILHPFSCSICGSYILKMRRAQIPNPWVTFWRRVMCLTASAWDRWKRTLRNTLSQWESKAVFHFNEHNVSFLEQVWKNLCMMVGASHSNEINNHGFFRNHAPSIN